MYEVAFITKNKKLKMKKEKINCLMIQFFITWGLEGGEGALGGGGGWAERGADSSRG